MLAGYRKQTAYSWEGNQSLNWSKEENDEEDVFDRFENERQIWEKNQQNKITDSVKRGIIRTLIIVVDMGISMIDCDFPPSRHACVCRELSEFVESFFSQNPLRFFLFSL